MRGSEGNFAIIYNGGGGDKLICKNSGQLPVSTEAYLYEF